MSLWLAAVLAVGGAGAMAQGLGFWHKDPPAPHALSGSEADAVDEAARRAQADVALPPDTAALPAEGLGRAVPTHLTISRVGIDTSLMELGLSPDGTLQVPPDARDAPAGWYGGLASPGEVGPAVIVGHLDAPDAPAVFYNLGALRAGDRATITRADGSVVSFRVREVGTYPREYFPTAAVYGPSRTSVLRLVTCGGSYSHGTGYTHNVIVFADLVGTASAPEPSDTPPASTPVAPPPQPQTPTDPSQTVPGPSDPAPVVSRAHVAEPSGSRQASEPVRRQYQAPRPQAPPPVQRPRPVTKKEKPEVVYVEEPPSFDPRAYD